MDSLNENVPTVQRLSPGTFWEGQRFEASFAQFLFFRRFFCSCHPLSILSFADHNQIPPDLGRTCPMFPCTSLHLACAYCVLSPPPKPFSSLCTLSFLFHAGTIRTGRFRAVERPFALCLFLQVPQSPLHTLTTAFLTCFSLFVRLCAVKWTLLFSHFLVQAAKHQKKVRNKVFLPCSLPL
jgi:hypothetical protein